MSINPENSLTGLEIAVIGMAARFPQAKNTRCYWENLKQGVEAIAFFSEQELIESGFKPGLAEKPGYVKAKALLADVDCFDSAFFDYSSREAELMDPQMRIFHELAWEALEDAGYAPGTTKGLIGLYAGAANNHHWIGLSAFSGKTGDMGHWAAEQLVDKGYLTMRLSYKFNLKGPSYSMYTACSTSLVAIHLACQSILNGECDMALAGGITITLPRKNGYMYQEGMIMSPDGHCRVFDADAAGTVVGNGGGIVALKRLEDARADNDHIYALVKGSAINNDGIRKSGFTAPSVEGQVEVLRTAMQMSGLKPENIRFIEAHGTGTAIGDPIEIEALTLAFASTRKNFCALGSVKSNIGHLDAAAGIAGFIKAVLALAHRQIPPSLHYRRPNPRIDFENSPFYVNTTLTPMNDDGKLLRAGVSSFGIGGTNAHVILEEAPRQVAAENKTEREYRLILLSAKTEPALETMTQNLAGFFKENPGIDFTDAAYTLQVGRENFKARKMTIASTAGEAISLLEASADPSSPGFGKTFLGKARDKNRLVFMFSGQGSQYVNMGRDLYRQEPLFRREMDRCFEILNGLLDYNIKEILYPGSMSHPSDSSDPSDPSRIDQTEVTQPLLFAFEYALAKLLDQWGLKPYAMIGHSIGEYTAACLAGVFSLEEGLRVAAWRGKLMQQMQPGTMLSVSLSEGELEPLLRQHPELALAAVNAPSLCVVSGPPPVVAAVEDRLKAQGVVCKPLHTSHAFHSSLMDPVLNPFESKLGSISLKKPHIPFISNVTGKWISFADAVAPSYWANHLRSPVRFSAGISLLLNEPNTIFIEVGPGRSLATLVKKQLGKDREPAAVLNLVKHPREDTPDNYYLLSKIGQLWIYGEVIDWAGFYREEKRQRISLPAYPFEKKRYWLEPGAFPSRLNPGGPLPGARLKKQENQSDWFYTPNWRRTLPLEVSPANTAGPQPPLNWLFFMDEAGLGNQLLERLDREREGSDNSGAAAALLSVRTGAGFAAKGEGVYTVNPRDPRDYHALIAQLQKENKIPDRIVHLWNVGEVPQPGPTRQWDETNEDLGFYSLIHLAQAIGQEEISKEIKILVVTNNMQEVSGGENLCPLKATVLGPVGVIPREYPNLSCVSVDVVLSTTNGKVSGPLVEQLLAEAKSAAAANGNENMIAYRHPYRWKKVFDPLPLASPPPEIPRLRAGGVYLITGGLGGIGLVLAQYLAKTVKAKLILINRSPLPPLPPKEEDHPQEDSEKIRRVRELEALASGVMVFSADVSDYARMQAVIAEAEGKWGPINGVIHAAGVPGGGLIQLKTREQADGVLLPKVKGTLVLNRILGRHALDFFILCSSINAVLPFLGQVDYNAANAFLDAFASYKTSHDGIFTVSINWDTWQEVGMAVKAAKQLMGVPPGRASHYLESAAVSHPLFDRLIHEEPQKQIYVTHFKFHRHWVLSEHKITDSGKGLVPGVTYLEMAWNSVEPPGGSSPKIIEISDVYFLNPLVVGEDQERETGFILEKQVEPGEYEFLVQSRAGLNDADWQKHAVGKISARDGNHREPVRHDIDKIAAACGQKEVVFSTAESESHQGLLTFGPRWASLRRVLYSEDRGLAYIQLAETFAPDLESYKLHPALLDIAAGFLFRFISPGSAYIPFAYKSLSVMNPLPAKLLSYSRLVKDDNGPSRGDTLKFDVTIMDEQGRELVDIKEFTLLQVSEEVKAKMKQGESRAGTDSAAAKEPLEFLINGLLPAEGSEVLGRILAGALPQVVVSTLDLPERIRSNNDTPSKFLVEDFEKRKPSGPLDARPEISTVYVAPRTDMERRIAGVWQEILGLDKVGIHDDFFELGGDSLNIVQLNSVLKKTLNRDIPVATLFRYLNIQSFVQHLNQEDQAQKAPGQIASRAQVIKESKNRLKTRINRRSSLHES